MNETRQVILLFLAWRIGLLIFAFLGVIFLPLHNLDFFGGSIDNYATNPLFWGWANFDGDYYLKIAVHGYQSLTHSFFPLYPLLSRYLAVPFGTETSVVIIAGLIISNLSFLISLLIFWGLVRIDYSRRIATFSIAALVVFPTSFYFGAMYTESLFLLLVISSFYAARKEKWFLAGLLGAFASATRVVGIFLLPALLLEWWQRRGNGSKNDVALPPSLFLIPLGVFLYMLFLRETIGDPLAFFKELQIFGEQRSGQLIPLYQVFWRYAKMLFTTPASDPIYITVFLEALSGILGIALLLLGYLKKVRVSYLLFAFLGYILPTLTGSFSSLPRYLLVLFPLFIILGLFLSEKHWRYQLAYFTLSITLLAIETALFIKGYWVA